MTWQRHKLLTLGTILLLAGCQGMYDAKQGEETPPAPKVEAPPPAPVPELTFKEYQRRAIDALQVGNVEAARQDLNKALAKKPRNRLVRSLLAQIDDKNPKRTLGRDYFEYTVQAGDTLSTIADRFLGNGMQFYILARYNGIKNPSKLFVGQTIKVPSRNMPAEEHEPSGPPAGEEPTAAQTDTTPEAEATETADTAQTAPLPVEDSGVENQPETEIGTEVEIKTAPQVNPESDTQEASPAEMPVSASENAETGGEDTAAQTSTLAAANELYRQQRYADAVETLTAAAPPAADSPEQALLVDSYKGLARQLEGAGELDQARSALQKAAELAPEDDELASDLARVADSIEAQRLYDRAQEQIEDNQLEAAYQSLNEVLVYAPDHPDAMRQVQTVKQKLIQDYHRKAMQYYRKRELDQAIEYWDKVLALEPNHDYAQGYRLRALELKQKLDHL